MGFRVKYLSYKFYYPANAIIGAVTKTGIKVILVVLEPHRTQVSGSLVVVFVAVKIQLNVFNNIIRACLQT